MTSFVLLADLERSRKALDRPALARKIKAAIQAVNRKHAAELHTAFVTTKGFDEVSGVLTRPDRAFDLAVDLNIAIWPQRFRYALAQGSIDVGFSTGNAAAMDGPVFHAAAMAINRARRFRLMFALEIPCLDRRLAGLIESVGQLHAAVMTDWSQGGADIVRAWRSTPEEQRRQDDLARVRGVSQQAISSALRKTRLKELELAEEKVRVALAGMGT